MLEAYDYTEPMFFGEHFKAELPDGFLSGGAGYVLSKEALRRYGNREQGACNADFRSAEDVFMSDCLHGFGVLPADSRDEDGRQRFHCLQPAEYLVEREHMQWYIDFSKYPPEKVSMQYT